MGLHFFGHRVFKQSEYDLVTDMLPLTRLKDEMIAYLRSSGTRGISAPQLGYGLQYCVIQTEDGNYMELINPQIMKMYGVETYQQETCLSYPPAGNGCRTPRMQIIEIVSGLIPGRRPGLRLRFKGQDSRTIQHEVDHLNGGWFFDRAEYKDRKVVNEKFEEWRRAKAVKVN